jgi:hypothetical protein
MKNIILTATLVLLSPLSALAFEDMTMTYAGIDQDGYPVYSGEMVGSCVGQEGIDYAWITGQSGYFRDAIDGNSLIACSGLNEYNPASNFTGTVYLSGGANSLDPPLNFFDEFGINYVDYCEMNNGGWEPCTIGSTFRVYFQGMTATETGGGIKSGVLFGRSGESQTVNQNGGSLLAAVGFVSSDTFGGVFPYLMLSVGVFVGFYIIQKLIFIVSGDEIKIDKKKNKK